MTEHQAAALPAADELRKLALYSGEPWTQQNEYHARADAFMAGAWDSLIWPFISDRGFSSTLDLACGGGRNSVMLAPLASRHIAMDILADNVEATNRRLADFRNVRCFVNNGYDLQPAADASITLVYCFDAMVHFDSDVIRSYLRDTRRVLTPGGSGFFHHSGKPFGPDWRENPSSRAFMTPELFAHYARKEGLRLVRQRAIDWDGIAGLDCFSLVERPND